MVKLKKKTETNEKQLVLRTRVFLLKFNVCVCVWYEMYGDVERPEDNFMELVLSFNHYVSCDI